MGELWRRLRRSLTESFFYSGSALLCKTTPILPPAAMGDGVSLSHLGCAYFVFAHMEILRIGESAGTWVHKGSRHGGRGPRTIRDLRTEQDIKYYRKPPELCDNTW